MHRASSRPHQPQSLVLLGLAVLFTLSAGGGVLAQTAPAPAGTPGGNTDNTSTLFPDGGTSPPSSTDATTPGAGNGRRRGQGNGKRGQGNGRTGRKGDVLAARASSEPLEVRVAFRKAKTEALLRRPDLAVIEREADVAPTDDGKRSYLRSYYTQLYSEVKKIDPSPAMAEHVKLLSSIAEQRYDPKRRTIGGDEDLVRGRRGRGGKRR